VRLIIYKEAIADIYRLREFLADRETRPAQRVVAALYDAIWSREVFPGRGRPSVVPGVRELVVPFGRSAYLVRYAHLFPELNRLVIIRVWHGREAHECGAD
jgi:plasmid stabilization system protein ParE